MRGEIEAAKASLADARDSRRAIAKGGADIEDGVSVKVLPGRDAKGRARSGNDERADAKAGGEAYEATEEEALANVERSAAIVLRDVAGSRRYVACACSVAVRVVQSVVSEQRKLLAHLNSAVHDQLVLFEDAAGLILVVNFGRRRSAGGIGVDEIRVELMDAAGIEISDCEIRRFGELVFQGDAGLHDVRGVKIGIC